MASGGAVIITLVLMRFIQILFNIMASKSDVQSQAYCRNIMCGILFAVMFIITQVVSMILNRHRYQSDIDTWKTAFITTYILEITLFDALFNPLIIMLSLRSWCTRASYRFLSPALTQRNTQQQQSH